MKQKTLLKTMLLLCALIVGSSSVWADDYELYSGTITEGDYVIVYSGVAMKNTVSSNRLQYESVTISNNKISDPSVALVWHIAASGEYWTIYNADVEKYAAGTGTKNQAGLIEDGTDDKSLWTVSGSETYEFVNKKNAAANVNKNLRYNSGYGFACYATGTGGALSLYKKSAAAPTKVSKPSISGAEAFLTSTQVTITCGTTGATIQYSTDGGTNWTNYSAAFSLTETTTVKAKATKSGLTESDVASQTFTKVTPTTVAAALTAINALADNGTIAGQCVAGIISKIDYYSDNAITYWISDDGTTTSQLEVYKGKGLNGANFSAKTDMNVGDEVTVFGTLKKFVNGDNTTPEFDAGSQLLSYSATGTPVPSINASNVTIDSEATSGEITYTIDNPTTATLTAAKKTGDWISNVTVDAVNKKVTFTTTVNDGEQRFGYITLSYTDAVDKDVKITQKATYGTASLPFAFDAGKSAVGSTDGLTHNGLGSDYTGAPLLKFDDAGDYLILKINAAAEVVNFDIAGNGTSTNPWGGGTFKVQTSADGVNYTDLQTYTDLTSDISRKSVDLTSSVRYIKWIYTTKGVGNVALGRIGVNCEAVTIPTAGYASFYTPSKINFAGTTGVKAYKVSAVGDDNVTLTEIAAAPANTPVILKANTGTYGLELAASAGTVTGNLLNVSDGTATTDASNTVYALASKGESPVVGFYKVKAGVKVPAGKCYISVAASSNPARDFLGFGDETTAITNVNENQNVNENVFDLSGRRVAQPTKGLYIVNGKKVIIK